MIRAFREGSGALRGLLVQAIALREMLETWPHHTVPEPPDPPDLSPLTERLDRLEVGQAKWQAEAEATLLKADALFKNARNAEERTRSRVAKADEDDEESAEFAAAYEAWIQARDASEGPENGVRTVREGVEVHPRKALALRAKFS